MSIGRRIEKLEQKLGKPFDGQDGKIHFPVEVMDPLLKMSDKEIEALVDAKIAAAGLTRDQVDIFRIHIFTAPFRPDHPRFEHEPYDPLPGLSELSLEEKLAYVKRFDNRKQQSFNNTHKRGKQESMHVNQ